jgi:alanine racemase
MISVAARSTGYRPTEAVVDLDAVRHNLRALKPPAAEVRAVVKADGYGHGAVQVARAAVEAGASWLGVALVEEGLSLREAGASAPILVLSEFPPGAERAALEARLTPTLYTAEGLAGVRRAMGDERRPVRAHVKVDTGMHRVGLSPEDAPGFVRAVGDAGIDVEGIWTHFARADEVDSPFTARQMARFQSVVDEVRSVGCHPTYRHAANTAATMADPLFHLDMVRLGIGLYGLPPGRMLAARTPLRPAVAWRSAVAMVKRVPVGEGISYGHRYRTFRDSFVATVPVGYGDGYHRAFGDGGQVLIGGRRRPVAGTVTMDHIMADCGDDPVEVGDEVVLLGRQGQEEITADELAALARTINYEVVCAIGTRVRRRYVHE